MDANKNITIIMMYIICLVFSLSCVLLGFSIIPKLNNYYISILIPMIVLFLVLALSFIVKIFFSVIEQKYGKNDNDEVTNKINKIKKVINDITQNSILMLLVILLVVVMVLDFILCINKEKYLLLSFSIVVWILLIYNAIKLIIGDIRKE